MSEEWGGEPVRLSPGGGLVPASTPDWSLEPAGAGTTRSGVQELLAIRPRERARVVDRLLSGGLSPANRRLVMVGSLWGGTGVSTLSSSLAAVWAGERVPAVLLDASGQDDPGLPDRVDPQMTAGCPQWSELPGDPTLMAEQFVAVAASSDRPVLVTGGGPSSAGEVAAVAGAAQAGYGLVVIDAGSLGSRIREIGAAACGLDLLVMVCRPSEEELRRTAAWLRSEQSIGRLEACRAAVIAVIGAPTVRATAVAAAMTVVSDAAAGPAVRVDTARDLTVRTAFPSWRHPVEGTRLVAAAIAASGYATAAG